MIFRQDIALRVSEKKKKKKNSLKADVLENLTELKNGHILQLGKRESTTV